MPPTHLSLHYHLIFSTKNRESWLAPSTRPRVHEYIGGIIRTMGGVAHAVGGMGDHVHVFAGLRATHCLADVMRELKSDSSRWVHGELRLHGFAWQEGYGAFTVGAPDIDAVRAYALNQDEHHRVKNFQEEYVAMLKRGMVEYNEKYLWRNGTKEALEVRTILALLPERRSTDVLWSGGSAALHHRLISFVPAGTRVARVL